MTNTSIAFFDDAEPLHHDHAGRNANTNDSGGEGGSGISRDDPPPSMADPVTRHAPVTKGPVEYSFLACGVDTLDVSLHVYWSGSAYKSWIDQMIVQRNLARQSDKPMLFQSRIIGPCLVFARGKNSMHQFHIQTDEGHFYFQAQQEPVNGTPNVLVSPHARLLWHHGIDRTMELITERIRMIGGDVRLICPSRCDFAADFEVPQGFSLDFLRAHRVCKSQCMTHYMTGDSLETCYFGKRGSDLMFRIYDKSLEIERSRFMKAWFYEDVWKAPISTRVWRVEAQVRRTILRKFSINSIDDLKRSLGALWKYFTEDWLSFRLLDDSNTSRRTVHPWWQVVQQCGRTFGTESNLIRAASSGEPADADWYVRRAAAYLASFAAARGILDMRDAAEAMRDEMLNHWQERDWIESVHRKRLEQGKDQLEEQGGDDDAPF